MGHLDYDRIKIQVVYDIKFPEREDWVIQDSVFYHLKGDSIVRKFTVPYAMNLMDFDIILNDYNHDFLFQQMGCELEDIKREGDNIFKLWKAPELSELGAFYYILAQSQGQNTTGLAYMDESKRVIGRQYYADFKIVDGLNMPHSIEQRVYSDSTTYVKKLILKDVSLNNQERNSVFRDDLDFLPIRKGADKGNIREELELLEEQD